MTNTGSNIERILDTGGFVVTSECGPPRGADAGVVRKKGELLRGVVDAVNVTDNQTSVVRMSSLSACVILKEMGFDLKKSQIELPEPIKEIGEFPVKIKLEHNLEVEIRVIVAKLKEEK